MSLSTKLLGLNLGGTFNSKVSPVISLLLGSPALGATDAVVAATALTALAQTGLTAGITSPDVARNVTITGNAGGNAGNVKVYGTDEEGTAINETIALSGSSTVVGSKAFATVTSYDLPAETHAGTDTVKIGLGAKLGIGVRLSRNTTLKTFLNGVVDTISAVAVDATNLSGNTVTLTSSLAAQPVILDFYLSL